MVFQQRKLLKLLSKLNIYSARRFLESISILRHMGSGGVGSSGFITITSGGTYSVPQGATHISVSMVGGAGGGGSGGSGHAGSIVIKGTTP